MTLACESILIREAVADDLPRLLEMGRAFFGSTGYARIVPFDDESTGKTLTTLIQEPSGVLLVAESECGLVGMVGGMVYPFYFNLGHVTGQEFFWYMEPDSRHSKIGQRLMAAFEQHLQQAGAQSITMIALDSLRPDAVGAIYRRAGYIPSEHSYIKGV